MGSAQEILTEGHIISGRLSSEKKMHSRLDKSWWFVSVPVVVPSFFGGNFELTS